MKNQILKNHSVKILRETKNLSYTLNKTNMNHTHHQHKLMENKINCKAKINYSRNQYRTRKETKINKTHLKNIIKIISS